MFEVNQELFKQSMDETMKAIDSLNHKKYDIDSVLNISENYEGKDVVDNVAININEINNEVKNLLIDMTNTYLLMSDNEPSFETISFDAHTMPVCFDIKKGLEVMKYWLGNGISADFLTVCSVIGGSRQGQDQCLATARMYAQLVCQYLGIESTNESVRNGEVGYVFNTQEEAFDYIRNEIEAGYPVTLEVSNSNKKHFVMAYGIKLDENGQIPEHITENDILYLDPVEGEVKVLGTSWNEYELMARHLMHDDNVDPVNSSPLGVHGYWVGTYSGNEPQHYKNKTNAAYQGNPPNDVNSQYNSNKGKVNDKEKWANPYAPFDYYVSITLSDGTIISSRDFSNEELANNSYTLPQNQLPNNLPWVNPNATSTTWYGYLNNANNSNYQAI